MNQEFLDTLRQELGSDHIRAEAGSGDFAGLSVGASCSPESEEQVAKVIQCAAKYNVPVFPCGSGTAMYYGNASSTEGLLLRLDRMNQMLDYQPADMVATAQAGMTVGAFQTELARHGQWLPLDVPPEGTLGGMLALDRSGPRRINYGTLRDMVLGMKVVNGDGILRKCGGKVVKNVTGYALEKMYIGSLGTLGIITSVTVKVCPKPEAVAIYEVSTGKIKEGLCQLRCLVNDWPFAFAVACLHGRRLSAAIGVEGSESDGDRLAEEIRKTMSGGDWELRTLADQPMNGSCWHALPRPWPMDKVQADEQDLVVRLDWLAKASVFEAQLEQLEKSAGEAGFSKCISYFEFQSRVTVELFSLKTKEATAVAQGLDTLLAALRSDGMAVTVVWKRPDIENSENAFGPPRLDWGLMQKIKRTLDPEGILNPHRFLPGLD